MSDDVANLAPVRRGRGRKKPLDLRSVFVDGLSMRDTAERPSEALLHDGVVIGDTLASALFS